MMDWLFFVLIIFALWYWWDTLHSKEIARVAGLKACEKVSVQWLDETVELKKQWLRRGGRGYLQICRLYFFEFTSDGSQRYKGRIILLGQKLSELEMDAYRISD